MEDQLKPEIGDTVVFKAQGQYGEVSGDGVITEVFKNGNIKVEMGGLVYSTRTFEILSKAW